MILAIETSSSVCSTALEVKGQIFMETLEEPNRHSEHLAQMVKTVLGDSGITAAQLEGILVSGGPGSFTGLRIGMSYAKGLALPLNCPMGLVGSMDALAGQYRKELDAARLPLVIFRSHRENVFVGTRTGGKPQLDIRYHVLSEVQDLYSGVDLILTNDADISLDGVERIYRPLDAGLLITHYAQNGVSLTTDTTGLKLRYGIEYKAKKWNQ